MDTALTNDDRPRAQFLNTLPGLMNLLVTSDYAYTDRGFGAQSRPRDAKGQCPYVRSFI